MSALSRIRQNIGLIAIVIFIALAAFILTDFIRGITTILRGVPEAGNVAGVEITNQEYQEQVSLYSQNSGAMDDLQSCQLRTQVWNNLVREKAYQMQLEGIGLEVTGEELYQMFAGEEISPIVRSFMGIPPQQQVTPTQMKRVLENLQQTQPDQLTQLEELVAQERGIQRFNNMLAASYIGSDAAARRQQKEANTTVDLNVFGVNYGSVSDSAVNVSDADLREYLREHEEEFQQDEQTVIRFVRFQLIPTRSDSMKVYNSMLGRRENFAATSNDTSFTRGRTRTPFTGARALPAALPPSIRDSVISGEAGQVFGPVQEGGYYRLYKLVGTADTSASSAKINHILITYDGDSAAAMSEARTALGAARGDFAAAAAEYSDDPATRNNGGELGWYRRGQFGADFDEAIDGASAGSVIGPIEGRGGYHIVQVVEKVDQAYSVANIEEEVIFTKTTRDSVYGVANNFAANLVSSEDINATAAELGFPALQSNPLSKTECNVGGGLQGGRELVVWAVSSDVGDVSRRIFTIGDNYVVAQVISRTEEGVQDLEQVREMIRPRVVNAKKAEYLREQLSGLMGQDLNAMQQAYGNNSFVRAATGVTFSSSSIPNVGAEPKLLGRAMTLEPGETSGIIEGVSGVYVIQATAVNPAPEVDAAELSVQRSQLSQQGRFSWQNSLGQALIEMNDVDDNRIEAERRRYEVN